MEEKIKELLEHSNNENTTIMDAWIKLIIAIIVLGGAILYFLTKKGDVKEPVKNTPEPEPLPEPEPEPEKEAFILEVDYTGQPIEIPATDQNSFVNEKGDEPFTVISKLKINKLNKNQWIVSKRGKDSGEYEYMVYKNHLIWNQYEEKDHKPNSIGRGIPVDKLPEGEWFHHAVVYDGEKGSSGYEHYLNGKPIETVNMFDGTYKGMTKTNNPVTIGKLGYNNSNPFDGEAEITIQKEKRDGAYILNHYKKTFGIEDVYISPDEDGIYRPSVEPSEQIDLTEPLNDFVNSVPNNSTVEFEDAKYWIERSELEGTDSRGSIDLYVKKGATFKNGAFFTIAPATDYKSVDISGITSKRANWKGQYCEDIVHENQSNLGTNIIDAAYLGLLPDHKPEWWGGTREAVGYVRGEPEYEHSWEFEHGFYYRYSKGLTFKNCHAFGVWGDGFSFWYAEDVKLINCTVGMIGRQGAGFSNGCNNILIDGLKAVAGMARTYIDLEPQSGGYIENVEIKNCHAVDGHIAAGGAGYVNNLWIHNNPKVGSLLIHGGLSFPRHDLIIEDNDETELIEIRCYYNVKVNGNKFHAKYHSEREAIDIAHCGGRIEIMDNEFPGVVTINLTNINKDADVVISGNTPEPIINITYN